MFAAVTLLLQLLIFRYLLLKATSAAENSGVCESDRIDVLPGVPFDYNFGQFAGFLNASNDQYQHYLHYWLLESQNDPDKDPLLVWFNGGPGSSSINSILWQVGPFHVNKDGQSLYENVYAWNKAANLLAIDSPAGVGWSFAVDDNINTTDEQVRDDSFRALLDFFNNKFPKFRDHEFYLTGLSYAGIYIPMLAAKIVNEQMAGRFPTNLTGIAIQNGWFSHRFYKSSLLHFLYYHGIIGYETITYRSHSSTISFCRGNKIVPCLELFLFPKWNKIVSVLGCAWHNLISTCCPSSNDSEACDFYSHVTPEYYDSYDYSDGTTCGDLIELLTDSWMADTLIDYKWR